MAVEHGSRQNAPEPVEPATLRQYTYHVKQYIEPQLGEREESPRLPRRRCSAFRDRLLRKLSRGMARKMLADLKAILAEADYHGDALKVIVGKDSKRHKEPVLIPRRVRYGRLFSVLDAEERPRWQRGGHWSPLRFTPACGPASFVACRGRRSISSTVASRSCSAPTRRARSAHRRARQHAARLTFRRRWWRC